MRTTLEIADDVMVAAKELARAEGVSIGAVVSDLARRGLAPARVRSSMLCCSSSRVGPAFRW